jgi:CARDB
MKVKKVNRILLITNILALTALVFASIPVSAQTGATGTPTPAPITSLAADAHIYLPFIVRQAPPDLVVGGFEVTQAVQNLNNTVSLVAGKSTVLRVYVQTDYNALSGVNVSLSATRNGATLSPASIPAGPKSATNTWSRGDLNTSFNFSLPPAWLSGTVTLQIRVDPNNTIIEGNETNNLTTTVANFINVPALDVKVVPIEYNDPRSGLTFPPAGSNYLGPGLERMYPISSAIVTRREYITWSQNLAIENNWNTLLSRIATLKQTDNAPESQIYYGLVPLRDDSGNVWFRSGVAGIGYVGYRASVGLADLSPYLDGSEIANHEIGHNLGQPHAPCGVSGDPNFPYPGGLIGQYGLRVDLMQLFDPTVYADIMGYCEPVWISDYTYQALYNNQVAVGAASQIQQPVVPSLLVRANVLEDGTIQMEPAYTFAGHADFLPAESDYRLELLDDHGTIIASYPLPVMDVEEEALKFKNINTMVPLPGTPFSTLRITEKGHAAAERSLAPASMQAQAMPSIQVSTQGTVLTWGEPTTPAVVRYQLDGEVTWTTLAVDHLGGSLELDVPSLPAGLLHFEIILADQAGSTQTLDWENTR